MNRRLSRSTSLAPRGASRHLSRWLLIVAVGSCVALGSALVAPRLAEASSKRVVHYTFEQVWPAALRFLRLDESCDIVERDVEAGYVLFDMHQRSKKFRGALEIVRLDDEDGKPTVRLIVRIENQPNYTGSGLLRRFESKLRSELGEPRRRPAPDKDRDKDKDDEGKKAKDGARGT